MAECPQKSGETSEADMHIPRVVVVGGRKVLTLLWAELTMGPTSPDTIRVIGS